MACLLKTVQTEQEARARKIELEAAASLLGADAVVLNELMKNFQGSQFTFWQPPAFLQSMFEMIDTKTHKMQNQNLPPSLPAGGEKNRIEDK